MAKINFEHYMLVTSAAPGRKQVFLHVSSSDVEKIEDTEFIPLTKDRGLKRLMEVLLGGSKIHWAMWTC